MPILEVTQYETSDGTLCSTREEAADYEAKAQQKLRDQGFLPWEYCECGCHGFSISLMGNVYWCTTRGDQWVLYEGHGFYGVKMGSCKTSRAKDEFLYKEYTAALDHEIAKRDAIEKKIKERGIILDTDPTT